MYQNLPVIVYSRIADAGNVLDSRGINAATLWFFCRALDPQGSGWASFKVADAAKSLGRSLATIYRYVDDGETLKFFGAVSRVDGITTIHYSSVIKVCLALGLVDLGAITEVQVKDLKNMKAIATQAEVQKQQRASFYKVKKQEKRPPAIADKLLSKSLKSRGSIAHVVRSTGRFLFVKPEFMNYGGSQAKTAKLMGRVARTISRRLSERDREFRGLAPLERVQVATVIPVQDVKRGDALILSGERGLKRFFSMEVGAIVPRCNIYMEDLVLLGKRRTRWLLNGALAKLGMCR